jgi:non-specific serine/threonine protein kinase
VTLEVPAQPGRSALETLLDALRTRQLLLVLDNCEHLLEACARLAEALLRACPRLQILATSREPLGLAGERRWRVPSLPVPAPDQAASPAAVARCEAAQLFVERARAAWPAFALSGANAPTVAAVCARLDGIPLAIELAAARLGGLGLADLAGHLDQRFRLLTRGSPTALPRQQTLRATVEWSYGLLTPSEQALFNRLSVFAGGFTLEAAEAVCAGEAIATEEMLDLLARLVEKSLVLAEEADQSSTRYRLLETLRQYGRERLQAGEETAVVQRRHAAYYLTLAEYAEQRIMGPEQLRWLDVLEGDLDNLRAALAWCLDQRARAQGDEDVTALETGMRLAGALHWLWHFRDHAREGLAWVERALAPGASAPTTVRAKALCSAGILASLCGADPTRSQASLERSVALSRAGGATRPLVVALGALGSITWIGGQEAQAAAILEECLAVARAGGEPWPIAHALMHRLFTVTCSAAIERAEERARAWTEGTESLALYQAVGDPMHIATVQLSLGQLAQYEGAYKRARALFAACLPVLRMQGWRSSVAEALTGLGDVARECGDHAQAFALYTEGLALYRQLGGQFVLAIALVRSRLAGLALEQGDQAMAQSHVSEVLILARDTDPVRAPEVASAMEVQAALAAVQGTPDRALRLAGAAAALRSRFNRPLAPPEQATLERRLAPARQALSVAEQAVAWAAGQAMTREQAIAYALARLLSEPGPSLRHPPEREQGATEAPATQALSRTERLTWTLEHLRSVGPLSPREYMAALGVGRRTAVRDLHVLEARGLVAAQGTTTDRRYALRRDGP